MITALLYALIALHVLVLIAAPLMVGKERKPLTAAGAAGQVLLSATMIVLGVIALVTW